MPMQSWQTELQDILAKRLNEDQVRLVSFDLGIDYDRLKGQTKSDRVAALVEFCEQRALVHQLQTTVRRHKPDVKFDTDLADMGSRVKVGIQVKQDVLSFGDQKRTELIQIIAEQFDIEPDEIHILVEATGSTLVLLGMSKSDAEKLVSSYRQKDPRFKALDKAFAVQRICIVESEPGRREKLSAWRSHRFRGMVRLLLYLSGFVVLALSGLALARLRFPQAITLWTVLGALPGLIAWAALPAILAKFMSKVYNIDRLGDAFDYMFLCVFGPLFSQYPLVYVKEGQVETRSQALPQGRLDGPGGPCRYVVLSDNAVVLQRAGRRIAVVGPSVYTAGRFEKIQQVIDLRPQTRATTASLITRDGIPVKVEVGVTFRIRWRGEPTAKVPYPADPDALLQAAAGQAVFRAENGQPKPFNWADRISVNLDSTLRTIVARYRLDELLELRDPGVHPRSDLERNYAEELKKIASDLGAEITEVRLGTFEFDIADVDIKRQWMDTWRASWAGQVRVREAQAEAGAIRTREMAQAYAQLEMIAAITREFQSMTGDESMTVNLITLRFIEVIGRMAANPESAIFLPREALQTLDGVRKMLQEARGARSLEPPVDLRPELE